MKNFYNNKINNKTKLFLLMMSKQKLIKIIKKQLLIKLVIDIIKKIYKIKELELILLILIN